MKMKMRIPFIIIFFAVWAILAVVFAEYDLQIELIFYHPQSGWALFLEQEGMMILPIIAAFCLHFLIRIHIFFTGAGWKNLFHVVVGLLLFASSIFLCQGIQPFWQRFVFVIFYVIGLVAILRCQLNQTLCRQLTRVIFITLFAIAFTLIVVSVLKVLAGRLRFRDMKSLQQFVPWYIFHPFSGNYSFPSGHTANAAAVFCFYFFIPITHSRWKKFLFAAIPTIIVPVMAVSRIIMGAHYSSDVLFAMGIAVVCWWMSAYLYDKFSAKRCLCSQCTL